MCQIEWFVLWSDSNIILVTILRWVTNTLQCSWTCYRHHSICSNKETSIFFRNLEFLQSRKSRRNTFLLGREQMKNKNSTYIFLGLYFITYFFKTTNIEIFIQQNWKHNMFQIIISTRNFETFNGNNTIYHKQCATATKRGNTLFMWTTHIY